MPVTEVLQALGSWSIQLADDTPKTVLEQISDFGHVTVHSAHVDPRAAGDSLLGSSRYTGVVRRRRFTDDTREIGGPGMAWWLGDEDQGGPLLERVVAWENLTFIGGVRTLLPATVTERIIVPVDAEAVAPARYAFPSPRTALTDWVARFRSPLGPGEWRVNGDATFDAGPIEALYRTQPSTIVVRENAGSDQRLRGLPGYGVADSDREEWASRVVVVAGAEGDTPTVAATATLLERANPYRDLAGNPLIITRLVAQDDDDPTDPDDYARAELAARTGARVALELDTGDGFDIDGLLVVGDYVHVWDPDASLVDDGNEVVYQGRRLNPAKVRLVEATWPVTDGMGVAYRDGAGRWLDLTRWVQWETDSTRLTIGAPQRLLLSTISTARQIGYEAPKDSSLDSNIVSGRPAAQESPAGNPGTPSRPSATVADQPGGPVPPSTLRPANIIFVGDSITAAGEVKTSTSTSKYTVSASYSNWLAVLLRQRLNVLGTFGYSAQTATYIRSQLQGLLDTYTPNYVFLLASINSIDQNHTAATIIGDLQAMHAMCQAAGATVLQSTIPPSSALSTVGNTVAAKKAVLTDVNNWIVDHAAQGVGVVVVPMHEAIDDGTGTNTPAADTTQDGTHPNTYGAFLLATRATSVVDSLFPETGGRLPVTNADPENVLSNGLMSGTTGLLNFSDGGGGVADGWFVNTAGTQTVVPTKVTRSDGYGDWQQLRITAGTPSTADGINEAHLSRTLAAFPVSGGPVNRGDLVVAQLEFEADADFANASMFELQLRNSSTAYKARAFGAASSSDTKRPGSFRGVLRTPPITAPSDELTLYVFISGLTGGSTATIRLGRMSVAKYS